MGNVQLASAIESHTADTVEPVKNHASVAAREAAEPVVFELFVEFALFGVALEDFLKCRRHISWPPIHIRD